MEEQTKKPATQRALVPKLRFPEFRDAVGWSKTKLKDVLTEHKLKSDGKSEVYSVSVHKGVVNQKEHLGRSFAAADTSNYNLAKPYDVIYTKSPTGDFPYGVIKHNHNNFNVIVSPLYGVFSPMNKYMGYIFDAYFESPIRTSNYLAPITQKGAKNTLQISNETFLSSEIYLPHEEAEQQKIADCLSSLDELITAEAQKLNTLKAHKRGLMQQLFPAEGETLPNLRFPEFRDAEEWEAYTLIQVAKFRRGSFPQPYGLPEWYDEINGMPFIQVFDVGDDLQLKPKTKNKISKLASEQSVYIPKGTVIITIQGSIGRVAITQYDAYIDRTLLLFEEFLKPIEKIFFSYVIQLLFEIERQKAPGEIIKTITKEVLSDFVIRLPKIEEQQQIADCLSSFDELVIAQAQKLDALKAHKKGLMQQLFPVFGDEERGS